jgi:hypothetical protein
MNFIYVLHVVALCRRSQWSSAKLVGPDLNSQEVFYSVNEAPPRALFISLQICICSISWEIHLHDYMYLKSYKQRTTWYFTAHEPGVAHQLFKLPSYIYFPFHLHRKTPISRLSARIWLTIKIFERNKILQKESLSP